MSSFFKKKSISTQPLKTHNNFIGRDTRKCSPINFFRWIRGWPLRSGLAIFWSYLAKSRQDSKRIGITKQRCVSSPMGRISTGENSPVNSIATDSVSICAKMSISRRASIAIRAFAVQDCKVTVSCASPNSGVFEKIVICSVSISKEIEWFLGFDSRETRRAACKMLSLETTALPVVD